MHNSIIVQMLVQIHLVTQLNLIDNQLYLVQILDMTEIKQLLCFLFYL